MVRTSLNLTGERAGVGGVCEYRERDPDEEFTGSQNLILITGTAPDGSTLDFAQLEMTLLHELGHSFGSKHDFDLSLPSVETQLTSLRECSGHDPSFFPVGDSRIHALRLFEPLDGR